MEDQNKKVVLNFLSQIDNPSPGLLADDFELIVIGQGPSGKRRTKEEIQALQQVTYAAASGAFTLTPLATLADNNQVVVRAEGHLPLKDGRVYANEYSFHFELKHNRIARMITYCDTAYADRFFPGF